MQNNNMINISTLKEEGLKDKNYIIKSKTL